MSSAEQIAEVCDSIKALLLSKNAKYGDSALNPTRVMSKANAVEQILVRIDDKLSRISSGAGLLATDEDVVEDIIGYFVLLKIALKRQQEEETKLCLDAYKDAAVKGYDEITFSEYAEDDWIMPANAKDWDDFWYGSEQTEIEDELRMRRQGLFVVPETPVGFEVKPVKNDAMWDSDDDYMTDPDFKGRNLYDSPFS